MPDQITNYQCPTCGGPLHFSNVTQDLACDYCESHFPVAQIEAMYAQHDAAAAQAEAQARRERARQNAMLERKLVGQDEARKKAIMAEANKLVASAATKGVTLSLEDAVDQVLEGRAKAGGQQQNQKSDWKGALGW